ncbi:hypothetical protein [Actinokineospora enzanensis]|uniref:hypothetical protein n=1 Tax=Actinokineospora enzanensis TaxID=155975 RepID=UPI00038006EA|nr:hypothetical protein [Actinokineospora enzanensis]
MPDDGQRRETVNKVGGDVHGPSVQADTIQGGVHLYLSGAPVEQVEPGEMPSAVRSLLRAQEEAAHDMPYRLRGARRPSLADVYVRQDLGSGLEEPVDQPPPEPILDERGQVVAAHRGPAVRVVVRPPTRTVREVLDGADHVVITGGPGQGKSTLSLRLAASYRGHVIPLRLTARELATRLDLPFSEALAASARAEYGAMLSGSFDARLLDGPVGECRWLLLIDGLDEVADVRDRDRLVAVLARWGAEEGSPYRVVLTTRPIEGATLAPLQRVGAVRYELQPFDEEALGRFASSWFGADEPAERFVRQLRAAHLDELVRVPLLATIAAIVFERHVDRPLPDNQYSLYESYLEYLRTAHEVPGHPFTDELLEHLGRVRVETDTSLVAAAVERVPGVEREELVNYLAAVGPLSRRGDDLRFLHHSFAEHLAATAKARLLPVPFDAESPEFAQLLHAAEPEQGGRHARAVLLHYTRLHPPQADALITWLHARDGDQHLLAARLLAVHVPVNAEVIDAFLVTVGKWAMSTQYTGVVILAQTTRATHHPGLAQWLITLARNTAAPWSSRVEAAAALATRVRGPERDEATALLRAVVENTTIDLGKRLSAAEALSDCGGPDRDAAKTGLCSILDDPSVSDSVLRPAGMLLATFGSESRARVIDRLVELMDDAWSADREVVESAIGLAEISVDHHERCAEVFRDILSRPSWQLNLLRRAAFGLATLGGDHLIETTNTLAGFMTDKRLASGTRIMAGRVLVELGPQHRATAARLLRAVAAEPLIDCGERQGLGAALVDCGLTEPGLVLLRSVLDDPAALPEERYWAAHAVTHLGPAYRDEAAPVLRRIAVDPTATGYTQMMAWGRLAILGAGHRRTAVDSLRRGLSDVAASSVRRIEAARQLITLGPGYHGEVVEVLGRLVRHERNPDACMRGLMLLRELGNEARDFAVAEMVALAGKDGVARWQAYRDYFLDTSGEDDAGQLAGAVEEVAGVSPGGVARWGAVVSLSYLGRGSRQAAVRGALDLLGDPEFPADHVVMTVTALNNSGARARAKLIDRLCGLGRVEDADGAMLCAIAAALYDLGSDAAEEIGSRALTDVLRERTLNRVGIPTATTIIRAYPDRAVEILAGVLAEESMAEWQFTRLSSECVRADGRAVRYLNDVVSDRDTPAAVREKAAWILARSGGRDRPAALSELRAQAEDPHLGLRSRVRIHQYLAAEDELASGQDRCRSAFLDVRQPVGSRADAAYVLFCLAPSVGDEVIRALRAWSDSGSIYDRFDAVNWLAFFCRESSAEAERLALDMAYEPDATPTIRRWLLRRVGSAGQIMLERLLLEDRRAAPRQRVEGLTAWTAPELATEAEEVLRDVYTAVETSVADRVEAAGAFARMSRVNVAEAESWLESMLSVPAAWSSARRELAGLGVSRRERVVADARVVLRDGDRAARWRAAVLISELEQELSDDVAVVLEGVANRVEALWRLRSRDGLDPLRRIRDDRRATPALRWQAAKRLREFAIEDRAAGARVLADIATDPACSPTLRGQAAHELMSFGERGRELGAPILLEIAHDQGMPTIVRSDAARALGVGRPDLRKEVLAVLRGLTGADKPLARIQVWQAIGRFEAAEAAVGLRRMTREGLPPGVRLRAALAMIDFNRELRESAAVVAREVAHLEICPVHVRFKAARALAQLSELCRGEAQALLGEVTARTW